MARLTEVTESHMRASRHYVKLYTRFKVRVWRRSPLQASIERTLAGMALQAVISFWALRALPARAAHVKR